MNEAIKWVLRLLVVAISMYLVTKGGQNVITGDSLSRIAFGIAEETIGVANLGIIVAKMVQELMI